MAQANPEEHHQPPKEMEMNTTVGFKFNAQAPEFIPRSQPQVPISAYFYPCIHFVGGNGSDWLYVGDQEPVQWISNSSVTTIPDSPKKFLKDELRHKIIKQVEYQFSDASLVAGDSLTKHINKDPEGYVPISVIASSKKIKSLSSNHHMIATALRASSKLVVSEDGKKVRRKHLFTERDKEELQSRIVVVENLPEDYSYQNLEKIFGVVGSVKTVRICHPQESNTSRSSKPDVLISNKLHALVEYETIDQAEKAVEKLNDENWRKGLRVRLLLRRSPRSVIRSRKSDYDHFDDTSEDDEAPTPTETMEDSVPPIEQVESNAEDSPSNAKKGGWARLRGKSRGRGLSHIGRGLLAPSPQSNSMIQCDAGNKTPRGPRMPDGTRGFTMGRGKPVGAILAGSPLE